MGYTTGPCFVYASAGTRIDRTEFFRLTMIMASAACGPAPESVARVEIPSVPTRPDAGPSGAGVAAQTLDASVALTEPTDPAVDPSCSNAEGTLAACARIGPSCEGLAQECRGIGRDLRPRVAARFAECFAKAKGPKCRDKSLGACMRAAVESACIEPGATARCQELAQACRDAGKPPKYTVEQCAKVLSAARPSSKASSWDQTDVTMLGPSSEAGSCSLTYVLPYQPWGISWK